MSSPKVTWNEDSTISVKPPRRPKKLTGTRLAAVMGLNRWCTPFKAWCEITRTWKEPFEDTPSTLAGKAIEPLQIAYMREAWLMGDLRDPTDLYGPDYRERTRYDFFDDEVFGGMWDAVLVGEDGLSVTAVLEFKTTKRPQDWAEDVPEYYAAQAALYAYLLGVDQVYMVASFLGEADLERPEAFAPSAANTAVVPFTLEGRYGGREGFEERYVFPALEWWRAHVLTGRSPAYDEGDPRDRAILEDLRTAHVEPDADSDALLEELAGRMRALAQAKAAMAADERRCKEIRALLKDLMGGRGERAELRGHGLVCTLTTGTAYAPDEAAMAADGVWERYAVPREVSRMKVDFEKE